MRQITEEQIDYIPPTGVLVSVLRVCVLINNSAFIGCGEAAAGGGE